MSAPLSCTRCGYQNQPGYQFCSNCGAPLTAAPGGTLPYTGSPGGSYPIPPAYVPYPGSVDYERSKQIDRTKTGVLLILIGSLLSWIPVIAFVGYLLILIGVILEILGRRPFGPAQSRNSVLSLVLLIIGVLVLVASAVFAAVSNISGVIGPGGSVNVTPAFLASVESAVLLASIAVAVIIGIAEVLFTYALQAQTGRLLLLAGFGASLALAIALYLVLSPLYAAVVTEADLNSVEATQQIYSLLSAIPALLFATAAYLAWSRVSRREIPAPSLASVGMPPTAPPQAPPPSGPAPPLNPQ